jgi:hypothetical protein
MVTTEQETPGSATVAQRWPARQALVAGIAAEHNIPLLVISAGTRNHFALDPFGAYAAVVQSPAYRDDKRRTTTETLPGLLAGQQGPRLAAMAGDLPSRAAGRPGLQQRLRDGRHRRAGPPGPAGPGTLGLFAVTLNSAVQATGPLAGTHSRGLTGWPHPRSWSTPMPPRSRSGSTVRRCCSTPRALHRPAGRPAGPGAP